MEDLVTWLRAQLDADALVARAAGGSYPNWSATEDGTVCQEGTGGNGYLATGPYGDLFDVGHHIARHDPARVLREVEAKRRIIDEVVGQVSQMEDQIDNEWGSSKYPTTGPFTSDVLVKLLALPYADREGFREEWRP